MDDLWLIERTLWIDGVGAYKSHIASQCIMAFGPMGALLSEAIVESIKDAPRWSSLTISDEIAILPKSDLVVLSYKAEARQEGNAIYLALCTSTYIREEDRWKIVQHQQTPLGP